MLHLFISLKRGMLHRLGMWIRRISQSRPMREEECGERTRRLPWGVLAKEMPSLGGFGLSQQDPFDLLVAFPPFEQD